MKLHRLIINCSVTTAILAGSSALAGESAQDYFFGDSDLEQGNFQVLAQTVGAGHPLYSCGTVLCRDSNGPNWAEYLSPGVLPALAAAAPGTSLNFAVSGAHMTDRGDPTLPEPTGVGQQISWFSALQANGTIKVGGGDRFFVHAGTNDMLRLFDGEPADVVRADIVAATTDHVRVLSQAGARTIVVAKVQPVQYLPFLAGDSYAPLRQLASEFVTQTNTDLIAALVGVRSTLPTGTQLIIVDQSAFLDLLRRDHLRLGFSNFEDACADVATGNLCSSDLQAQNRYVFFDSNHFTTAGHALLADWYRATLSAASGDAALGSGRLVDAVDLGADRIEAEDMAARDALESDDSRVFSYGAAISGTARLNKAAVTQNGLLVGLQVPVSDRVVVAASAAYLEQDASHSASNTFATREWSVSGSVRTNLGPAQLSAVASYGRDTVPAFRRDVGALGLVTAGNTWGERYGLSAQLKTTSADKGRYATFLTRLSYRHVRIDGFEEDGAEGLNLAYARQSSDRLMLDSEAKFGLDPTRWGWVTAAPFIVVRDRVLLTGKSRKIESTLLGDLADPATVTVRNIANTGLTLGGGADLHLGQRVALGLRYEHALSGDNNGTSSASLRVAMRF
ncbi:autotransporter domain-containing protein [Asticcacaulis sp. AC402]|uniref:autotransporter domain-containing protein n=1 Tax=Asticcacaulis sp. AC402 TaxID=1282361 RepID=UPI0003C3CB4C|nr:autotransporter domain-containing protein [Asticcacaulis sp. AC402]ESQ76710.1 hypothetical protein ABAC402_03275 [Asticcacaulis sp. AC402]